MPGSILSQFMRGIFSTGFGRVMNLGLGMLSLMLVVRHISAEAYGAFVLIRVIYTFIAEASNFGLTLVLPKYLASSEDVQHKFRLINTIIYFRIVTILVFGLLILLVRIELAALFGFSPLLQAVFIYVPILFALDSLARTLSSILQGLFHFKILGVVTAVSATANFIATIVFVFALDLGIIGLIYAILLSNSIMIILAYAAAQINDKRGIKLPILKEMLMFGFPLQMQYMLGFVFTRLDTLVIGSFLGTAGIAFYEVARKLPDSFMDLFDSFRFVYFPFIAKFHAGGEREKMAKLLNNSIRVFSFLISFGTLVAVLFGREIISMMFSAQYLPSYYAFVVLMFGLNLSVLDNILGYSLVAIGEPNKPLIVNLVRAVISLFLNLVIIPTFGFIGASVVAVVSNLIAAPLDLYFLLKRQVRAEISPFLKPVILAGGYGVLFLLLGTILLPVKILFVFLFILTCLMASVVTREDVRLMLAEARSVRNRLLRKESAGSALRA